MQRRFVLAGGACALFALRPAFAHHGWSSFDQGRPIYLEGRAAEVRWRNPHAEMMLDVAPDLKLPPDLASRPLPAQTAPVDGAALLKAAVLPTRKDRRWQIELAPLFRLNAWRIAEIKDGDPVAMLGFTFAGERGDPVLRVEYLWSGGGVYALRSSPA
jgi:hypothetical protein